MTAWLRRLLRRRKEGGEWALTLAQENGETVVVRTRTRPPANLDPGAYPHAVELVWRFDGMATAGMPAPDVHALLTECEDLVQGLEGPANGLLGLSITGNGRREWVWYVADPALFSVRLAALLSSSKRAYPLEVRGATRP